MAGQKKVSDLETACFTKLIKMLFKLKQLRIDIWAILELESKKNCISLATRKAKLLNNAPQRPECAWAWKSINRQYGPKNAFELKKVIWESMIVFVPRMAKKPGLSGNYTVTNKGTVWDDYPIPWETSVSIDHRALQISKR